MSTKTVTYANWDESAAHQQRRSFIEAGQSVSLIAHSYDQGGYVFDVYETSS